MANPTKEVTKKNNSKLQKSNVKKMFFGKEGIIIGLDKDNFIGVVAYARIDLIFYTEKRSDSIVETIKKISRHVKYIIDSAKIGDNDVIYSDVNTKYTVGKTFLFQSIHIPYTNIYGKILTSLKRLKEVENANFEGNTSFTFRRKNSMKIVVNPNKSRNEDVFLKGYILSAWIPPIHSDDGEVIADEKFWLKSHLFVTDEIGISNDEIFKINRKELTRNVVSLFGKDTVYTNPVSAIIPFKRRINMIIYQADSAVGPGTVSFHREAFEIILFFRSFKVKETGKYKEDFTDPLGVLIKVRKPDTVKTSDLRDLIRDHDGNSLLYGSDNKISFDMKTFNDEAEVLNDEFISVFQPEEKSMAEENENVKTSDSLKENKKKSKKEKKNHSKKEENSEVINTEDNSEEEIETFDDVGSLADIEESDELENNIEDTEAAEIAIESEDEIPVKEETSEEIELPKE